MYQTSTVSDAAILAAEQRYDVDVSAPAPAGLAGSSVEASLEDALASPVRELGVEDGAKEGTLSSGARWWREEGKEYLEDGKVMSWTVIRGTSADGSVEWEEKFWETSDPFTYRELGAVKSGRDSNGQAWQESWKELYNHDANQLPFIHREASKWSHTPKGKCWSEGWTEDYRADGVVDRYCEKTGSLEDGAAPEDGHANRWTQKWGEKWDGQGGCIKWTDTWASRDHAEGGMANAPSRSWGEKWEEKWGDNYNENGRAGLRQGLAWDELGGNHKERTWGEEHYPDGRLHKYGNSNDGSQYWDEWCDGAGGWWETAPSFGWHEAIGHSPSLMNVRLQPRAVMGKGKNGRNIITPHRSKKGNTAPGASSKRCLQPQRIPRQREQPVQADQARLQRRVPERIQRRVPERVQRRVPERVQRVLPSHQRRRQRQRRVPSSGWLRPQRSERRRRRVLRMMHSIQFQNL